MNDSTFTNNNSIFEIQREDKEILLVGTAHISADSVEDVKQQIREWKPDVVHIELDEKRYQSLKSGVKWAELNLKEIIRKKQLSALISSLILGSYQKRMGDQTGVKPGSELLAAAETAEEMGIPFKLIDRDVKTTLKRVWRGTPFFKKAHLLTALLGSLFDRTEISEEELQKIKSQDNLSNLIDEMESQLPDIKRLLIDERDEYMVSHILDASEKRILAVVGAGHCPGMEKHIKAGNTFSLDELNIIPPSSVFSKYFPWLILSLILAGFATLAYRDMSDFTASLWMWVLVNGIPSSIGALMGLAHPLVIVSAFFIAPITSLNPMIGAGIVTAFMQAYLMPPTVSELESASNDLNRFSAWYTNRFLKIILAFILPSLGSVLGTYIGIADIAKRLLNL